MIRITTVDPSYVEVMWPHVEGMIESACKHSASASCPEGIDVTLEQLHTMLTYREDCRMVIVHLGDTLAGVWLCQYKEFTEGNPEVFILAVSYKSLNKEQIQQMMHKLANLLSTTGAKRITGVGRKGWRKVAPQYGWSVDTDGSFIYTLEGAHNGRN